ncbi:MAG TPA: polysaccharide pyruvyl transferase family protein [Candidatus Binatia bacterium]|jgi:pyruvyl transferase EpsO|nr:polysaccharide pyruvyl transferase family protein [Candidatus Binatia bacterium]
MTSDRQLVAALSDEIDRVMASLVRGGERVALVNFPNHANAGDPALWLGELASLARVGAKVVYRASWASYRRDELAHALGHDGTILLHGGGNFGDLYPHNQATTREQVLADFPRHRTIQLPQSLWFREPANRDRLRRLCEAHADFTLLVREAQSLSLARAHFAVPTLLCPDMVFALGSRARAALPVVDVLWLARGDVETTGYAPPPGGEVQVIDWLDDVSDEPAWPLRDRAALRLNRRLHLASPAMARRVLALTFAPLARRWVERGCLLLSRGRVVVTDRLHGHILSILQDIPHVVLDNSYGKLRSMFDTFTRESVTAHWADSPDEALAQARALVRP